MTPIYPPPPKIPGDLIRGNRTAWLGDSITIQNGFGPRRPSWSYATFASLLSDGLIRHLVNAGVSGNTTSQMLARVQSDVIAAAPARCVVLGGANDALQSVPLATTLANMAAIVARLRAAKIEPILCAPTPIVGYESAIDRLVAAYAVFAERHGLHLLNLYGQVVDPATGDWLGGTSASADGVHPTQATAKTLGQYVATQLSGLLPVNRAFLAGRNASSANLVGNGLFLTDANSNGLADNWSNNGGLTGSLVTGDTTILGNWQELVSADASQRYLSYNITGNFSVGDLIAFSGVVSITAASAGAKVSARVACTGTSTVFGGFEDIGVTLTRGRWYGELTIPASTTALNVQLMLNGAACTALFAQVTLLNLTTLGVA